MSLLKHLETDVELPPNPELRRNPHALKRIVEKHNHYNHRHNHKHFIALNSDDLDNASIVTVKVVKNGEEYPAATADENANHDDAHDEAWNGHTHDRSIKVN